MATYMAAIGIRFADVDSATDAARTLGASWKQSENRPNIIVAALSSSELAGFKTRYSERIAVVPCGRSECRGECHEVDGVEHSIDHGPDSISSCP
jgi:hypothetical protein